VDTSGKGRTTLFLMPYLISVALGTWIAYGPWVHDMTPVLDARSSGRDEAALCSDLRSRGIHAGAAQYWIAYRLTFLCGEDPVFAPLKGSLDRYAPYRRTYEAASTVALVFHPSEPRATPEGTEPELRRAGGDYTRDQIAGYTVLVWHKGGR